MTLTIKSVLSFKWSCSTLRQVVRPSHKSHKLIFSISGPKILDKWSPMVCPCPFVAFPLVVLLHDMPITFHPFGLPCTEIHLETFTVSSVGSPAMKVLKTLFPTDQILTWRHQRHHTCTLWLNSQSLLARVSKWHAQTEMELCWFNSNFVNPFWLKMEKK